jgi:hypothetical protein
MPPIAEPLNDLLGCDVAVDDVASAVVDVEFAVGVGRTVGVDEALFAAVLDYTY